jgi:hypothetical protein
MSIPDELDDRLHFTQRSKHRGIIGMPKLAVTGELARAEARQLFDRFIGPSGQGVGEVRRSNWAQVDG